MASWCPSLRPWLKLTMTMRMSGGCCSQEVRALRCPLWRNLVYIDLMIDIERELVLVWKTVSSSQLQITSIFSLPLRAPTFRNVQIVVLSLKVFQSIRFRLFNRLTISARNIEDRLKRKPSLNKEVNNPVGRLYDVMQKRGSVRSI